MISINALNLNQNLELSLGLSLNQQLMVSMLKMDFTELHSFLSNEFSKNPALEGELPSLITIPDYPVKDTTTENSLKNELLFQLHTAVHKSNHGICEYLIESLDSRGYITQNEIELSTQLGTTPNRIKECLHIIKTFEPLGVGASSLKECLLIQIDTLYPNDKITRTLVADYLHLLIEKDFKAIMDETRFSAEDIKASLNTLKLLNPIPGNGWGDNDTAQFITPDILLYDNGDELFIEMPDLGLDKLKLNPIYTDPENLSKYKNLLKDDLSRASVILKGLRSRQSTLYKIANIIITTQYQYLKYSKPLNSLRLIDIAEQLGIHESTVSRGIDGKYILYNESLIPIRNLLSRGNSDGTSVEQIKQRLYFIIQAEDKKRPLSDAKLVTELERYGISISRRTVAKYRVELKIEAASNRKS